jgi:hypothetical protein
MKKWFEPPVLSAGQKERIEDLNEVKELRERALAALRGASKLLESERAELAREIARQARFIREDVSTLEGRIAAMAALLDRQDGFRSTMRHPQKIDKKGGPKLREPTPGSRSGTQYGSL